MTHSPLIKPAFTGGLSYDYLCRKFSRQNKKAGYILQTVDVDVREWKDRENENLNQSLRVTLNYGTKTEAVITVPMSYARTDYAKRVTAKLLEDLEFSPTHSDYRRTIEYVRQAGVIFRFYEPRFALKTEVRDFGEPNGGEYKYIGW